MKRRHFLQRSGYFAAGSIIPVGINHWIARTAVAGDSSKRLIVIFLRGAIDSLSVVVPYRESAYYEARPRIAIPQPDQSNGSLKLGDRFALHPALAPIFPLWQQGTLAFVHACGSPDPTRSHFDAQDYIESGTPGIKTTTDGWMNRLLAALADHSSVQAINIGATTPRILSGRMPVASIASGNAATATLPLDRPQVSAAFDQLYRGQDPLSQAYREGQAARQTIRTDLMTEQQIADNGAPPARGFAQDAQRLARVMVNDPRVQLGFFAIGGWDTHVNQGATDGTLARNLRSLGQGLAVLQQSLGEVYKDTVILVVSEFGRTVHENGNGGTDHGHGSAMWIMGGSIHGGRVYGDFPGLQADRLYQNRDLAITTDFRDVVGAIVQRHFQLDAARSLFPNYTVQHQADLALC